MATKTKISPKHLEPLLASSQIFSLEGKNRIIASWETFSDTEKREIFELLVRENSIRNTVELERVSQILDLILKK